MQIVNVAIDILIEAEYNPRKMTEKQVLDLTASIKEFGLVDPILVNSNPARLNVVIGGHQRLKIARTLGLKEVPVVYIDLDLEREKRLNLRLNKNNGEWDWDLLANHFDTGTLVDVGFDLQSLDIGFEPERESTSTKLKKSDTFILDKMKLVGGRKSSLEEMEFVLTKWAEFTGKDPIRESDGVPWSAIKK